MGIKNIRAMKKILVLVFALLFIQCAKEEQEEGVSKSAQTEPSYNPLVTWGQVNPSPLPSTGIGKLSFLIGNSGQDSIPVVEGQELTMVITLSRGIPNNSNPLDALCGTFVDKFVWTYNPATTTYFAKQVKTLPAALLGDINIQYRATRFDTDSNGFNCNLQTPAFTRGYDNQDDNVTHAYTYCEKADISNPVTFVQSVEGAKTGELVTVPIRVSGVKDVGAISLTLKYDTAMLEYLNVKKIAALQNFMAGEYDGAVRVSAFWGSGDVLLTLKDNEQLFVIYFIFKGSDSKTLLTWDDSDDSACEYAGGPPNYLPFEDDPIAKYYVDGYVAPLVTGIREIPIGTWDGTIPVTRIQARRTGTAPEKTGSTTGTRDNSYKSKRR